MTRYLLAAGLAVIAWAITISGYIVTAALTGHALLPGWFVVATVAAAIVLWVETARALR